MSDVLDEMLESTEEVSANVTPSGMTTTEVQDFMKYLVGEETDPPEVMNKVMANLLKKLSMGLGFNVVANIGRQAKLAKFLSQAEEYLYDPSRVADMDREELAKLHSQAERTLASLQEFQRKVVLQNKDAFKVDSTPQEKLVSKLMTLPPEKVQKIMDLVTSEVEGKEVELNESDLVESEDKE